MVRQALLAVILEIPDEIAVPVEFLNPTAGSRALKAWLAIHGFRGPKEMTVLEQVGCSTARILARPGVNHTAIVVIKICHLSSRVNQVVAGTCARVIEQDTQSFGD